MKSFKNNITVPLLFVFALSYFSLFFVATEIVQAENGVNDLGLENNVANSDVVDAVQIQLNALAPYSDIRTSDGGASDARAALARPNTATKPNFEVSKSKGIFTIQEITCYSNKRIACGEVEQKLRRAGALSLWKLNREWLSEFSFSKLGGTNSFNASQVSTSSKVRDILTENPWIEDASIEFSSFRRTAQVTVQEAVPWFVTELRKSNWVVSKNGALLQEVNSIEDPTLSFEVAQLPRVRGIEKQRGASVTREAEAIKIMTRFLSVVNSMSGLPFEVESFELLDDGSIAISPLSSQIPTVFVRGDSLEDSRAKLELLRRLLADSRARGESLQRVDLRFKGRAVVVKHPETTPLSKGAKLS